MIRRGVVQASNLAVAFALVIGYTGCTQSPPSRSPIEAAGTAGASTVLTTAAVDALAERATVRIEGTSCDAEWVGSGFLVDLDGDRPDPPVVVTNRHVVEGSSSLRVRPTTAAALTVTGVSQLRFTDLAIISVDGTVPEPLVLASVEPTKGDHVRVFGYPGGGAFDRKTGTVHDHVREAELGSTGEIMRLDVWVRPGNSGGPVIDRHGNVVGVVYAIERSTHLGLAIPARTLSRMADDPAANREVADCESS